MPRPKLINIKGDLFATGASFAGQAVVKLGSSMILTRILTPMAYGTIAILMSIVVILVLLSDLGFSVCIVRSERGDQQGYLDTAWTIRIIRGTFNATVIFLAAPLIARLYHAPVLTVPFRVMSLWFLIDAFESTAFPVAVRRKNSRIVMYSELTGAVASSIFSVVFCYFSRDFWGMVYGILVNRLVIVIMSHQFYRDIRPRIRWDRAAAREIFEFTRFVMPSTSLTLFLNQFDNAVFLRLFDFRLLGIYSLAGNITYPVESLIGKASQMVLYPRCAHNFRVDRSTFSLKYYIENTRLYIATLAVPAAIGGAAHFLITLLYDPRYREAAAVLQAFMIRAVLKAFAANAEDMLIATGESRVVLMGNVWRVVFLVAASLAGYRLFGFMGFTYGIALSGVPALIYYSRLQRKKGFFIARYELYKLAFACGIALCSYLTSSLFLAFLPAVHIKLKL